MAKKPIFDYDLIVIGTGAGGSAAATIVARAGKRVAVIEAETYQQRPFSTPQLSTTRQNALPASVCAPLLSATTTLRF
jgi:choline dehydrogenase-like flavoprotein